MKIMRTLTLIVLITAFLGIASCSGRLKKSVIIFTIAEGVLNEHTKKQQFRIAILDTARKIRKVKIISGDFYSARYPALSFDGKRLAFSARKNADDPWQIYILTFINHKTEQVTFSDSSCLEPSWLPDEKILFSNGKSLFRITPGERTLEKITFDPYSYRNMLILADGRILTTRLNGSEAGRKLFVLRPDGTKAALFFNNGMDISVESKPGELIEGTLFFIYSSNENERETAIASIKYSNPFDSFRKLTGDHDGQFRDVLPISKQKLIVSWRNSGDEKYSLRSFNPETKKFISVLYEDQYFNAIEPLSVGTRQVPKKLPSEVDKEVGTGLIMCQNINHGSKKSSGRISFERRASGLRIAGMDSLFGEVKVEEDGSFYLKVTADKPFRISAIDSSGNLVTGPCEWMYLRPNERRGCVGCHEHPAIVPENRQPIAIRNLPVSIPISFRKQNQKITELE